jgi:hypothetical protein
VGDLVYSVDAGTVRAVPLREVHRTAVDHHTVVRVTLATGKRLEISAGHPTADGRTFGQLHAGDTLGGLGILEVAKILYEAPFTYDILPDSDTGTYFAGAVLIGSTLEPAALSVRVSESALAGRELCYDSDAPGSTR